MQIASFNDGESHKLANQFEVDLKKEFGVYVKKELVCIDARTLPPPVVMTCCVTLLNI